MFKQSYSKRILGGRVLGFPHRKRLQDISEACKEYFGLKALDIGCGDLEFDKNIIPNQELFIGIDLNWEGNLLIAKENITQNNWKNTGIVEAKAEHLPFKSNSFNFLLCCETLEHVSDVTTVLHEMCKVTMQDTVLVISVPIEYGPILLLKEFFRYINSFMIYSNSNCRENRTEKYSFTELFYAGILCKTDKVKRVEKAHKGFDNKKILELFMKDFILIKKFNTPFKWAPDVFSYGCIMIFKKGKLPV